MTYIEPSVGRIVHYYDEQGDGPYAALVTAVNGRSCDLAVFSPTGMTFVHGRRPGLLDIVTSEPGHGAVVAQHWFWPPFVGPRGVER